MRPISQSVRTRVFLVAAVVATLLTASPSSRANHGPLISYGYIPVAQGTPDATELHYKLILPDPSVHGNGPYPLVVDYSGYVPGAYIYDGLDHRFLEHGYAVAGVNIRGTGCSGGKFDYFEPIQSRDGKEAIDWLGSQRWSNGKVAMVGKSYPGITTLFVAAEQPERLTAIVPGHVFGDLYRDVPYPGGILNATFAGGWSAGRIVDQASFLHSYPQFRSDPVCVEHQAEHAPNPVFNPFVRAVQPQNNFDSDFYHQRSPWYFAEKIDVPTMLVQSYQDEQVGSRAIELIDRFRPGLPWRLVATNGDHGEYYSEGTVDDVVIFDDIVRFLAVYMKGGDRAAYEAEDKVVINWETGAKGGRKAAYSRTYKTWPPPHQQVWRLPLGADGVLGSTEAGAVPYTYAPGIGSQQRGGYAIRGEPRASWSDRAAPGTSASFTTPPLDADKVLLGTASVDLWVSSTAVDTDFEVTLSEVRPDGQEMFVQQGWLRASHRKEDPALSNPLRPFQTHLAGDVQPLVPLQPTAMRIEVFPFGHIFRAGSRVRLTIAAPHVRPDLWGFAALPTPARNTIHTGAGYPSSLALPLLAGETAETPLPPCTLRNQPCRAEPPA